MVSRDTLWKGIIEDLIDHMLRFFFPKDVHLIDFERGFEFLDKELEQLMPVSEAKLRRADKLIKAWHKNGEEHWFLFHVEVQGYADPAFAKRMFQSAYRIQDRYERPITALAIYTDSQKKFHVNEYRYEFWGTEIIYRFNAFALPDHSPEELAASDNVFAIVLEAARMGLRRSVKDDVIMNMKLSIVRRLVERGYDVNTVRKISNFIRYYVHFAKPENSVKFEKELDLIYKNRKSMGIEEAILAEVKQEGRQEGRQEGLEGGIQLAKRHIIANGLKNGVSENLLATLTDLSLEEVRAIINSLKGSN